MSDKTEILEKIFKESGLSTWANIYEVQLFIDDLYLQLNSDRFEEL